MKIKSLLFVVMLCACGAHRSSPVSPVPPVDTTNYSFVGTWHYDDTVVYANTRKADSVTVVITDTGFTAYGRFRADGPMITWFYDEGAWTSDRNVITFRPVKCQSYNVDYRMLQPDSCSAPYTAVLSGGRITRDGITWERQ